MGRHSAGQDLPYYRSIAAWFIPWVLVAIVTGSLIWFAVDAVGGPSSTPDVSAEQPKKDPSPEPEPEKVAEATPAATTTPEPDEGDDREEPVKLVAEGVTVQVLNATTQSGVDDEMADRLADLGFSVISIESASGSYPTTTVYWSNDSAQDPASALAERFGWVAEPKPSNLSPEVDLHVVVGDDAL